MLENATVSVYIPVITTNSKGTPEKQWGYKQSPVVAPVEILKADVQPKVLSSTQIMQYGLTDRDCNAKLMYFEFCSNIVENRRVYVVSDFPNELPRYYEIKGVNMWSIHGECLLIPVQGE